MSTNRRPEIKKKVRLALRARKFARENAVVVSALALVVVVAVTALFMRRVLAAKLQVRVLDCPVAHAVAHHHNESCYDDEGNLVCTLPERDLHVHDESCYQRQLVCGIDEGEGAHVHDENCYDAAGNLICGIPEGQGHVHDDGCYATVLSCGKEEATEVHVHGDGCFRVIAANEDAAEMTHPEFTFSHDVYDKDKNLQLSVTALAPVGALPQGAAMEVRPIDPERVDTELVQKTLDERAKNAQNSETPKLLQWQAVNISFVDARGVEIQPAKDVVIKLTSELAKTKAGRTIVRMEPQEKLSKDDKKKQEQSEPQATALSFLSDDQLKAYQIKLDEKQLAFASNESTTYVLATTSMHHEMEATDGGSVSIDVTADANAGIPADARLDVVRVSPGTKEYDWYVDRSLKEMGAEQKDVALAQFFDIRIVDGEGEEIEPQAPVNVSIDLADAPDEPKDVAALHFFQSEETMKAKLERLDATQEHGVTSFASTSLDTCGVVYTVDFGYQVEGKLYEYTIKGGGSVGLRELADKLHIYEDPIKSYADAAAFVADVQDVQFSDPGYLWVQRVGGETTLQQILETYSLQPQYASGTTEEQIAEYNKASYQDDWALVSLSPFTTTEMLTITMADGSQRLVVITDAQDDGALKAGGGTRAAGDTQQTIQNPADTRIDLFDYWITDDLKYAASIDSSDYTKNENTYVWPDWYKRGEGTTIRPNHNDDPSLPYNESALGTGYNKGINSSSNGSSYGEHNLKFNPSNGGTVPDGQIDSNGVWAAYNNNGSTDNNVINSWTGAIDGNGPNPFRGIVQNTLNGNGYPVLSNNLSIGADGEPLDYLFDQSWHAGKDAYPNVNNLLYVDDDGYYVFNSADYDARFVKNESYDPQSDNPEDHYSGSFVLTEQSDDTSYETTGNPNINGFWPFGNRVYWHGMHVNSDFSMPGGHDGRKGQVLNPRGEYKDMIFEFTGDDDTWIYIDGILVGDAGGVHNKTGVSINFSTGRVEIWGADTSTPYWSGWLDDIYRQAGKYDAALFDGHTFRAGTHHAFDMFYLERGGGESNLELKYNLITTADFNAHKAYNGKNNQPLKRDDFAFEIVGLDREYRYDDSNGGFTITAPDPDSVEYGLRAIMPENVQYASTGGRIVDATVANPYYSEHSPIELSRDGTVDAQVYATGVFEDGNVNFGTADTSAVTGRMDQAKESGQRLYPAYRYIIREIIPDTAVNPYGKNWYECTEEERRRDGFVGTDPNSDAGILYSGETYYMVGYVKEEDGEYVWKKKYFTDDTFTMQGSASYVDFKNRYATELEPLQLNLNKTSEQGTALDGAQFNLRRAMFDAEQGVWVDYVPHPNIPDAFTYDRTGTTANGGQLSFANLQPGYYVLEETVAPNEYELPRNKWLVTVHRVDWARLQNGTEKLYSELTENDQVVGLYSKCEMEIMQLSLEGAEIPGTTVTESDPSGGIVVAGNDRQFTIKNAQFQFNIEKHWEGIAASHSAIGVNGQNETQVAVTLGRYTIQDIAGTLNIGKYGVPAQANATITYNVYKSEGGTRGELVAGPFTQSTWDVIATPEGTFASIASISLPPGDYIVTEDVESDDPKYNADHPGVARAGDGVSIQGDTTIVTIEDEQTTDASFDSTYTPKTGKLYIKSTLNGASLVDPSTMDIRYTVTDNTGQDAYDINGNPIGPFTYDDVKNGKEIEVLIGRYRVTETGWTDVAGTVRSHEPEQSGGSTTISELVTDGGTATYEFTTTYEEKTSTDVYLVVYKYDFINGDQSQPFISSDDPIAQYGPFPVEGDSVTITYTIGTGDYPSYPRLGTAYFDGSFNDRMSTAMAPDYWQTIYTGTISLNELGTGNVLFLGNRWGTGSVMNNGVHLSDGTSTWDLDNNSSYTRLSESDTPGGSRRLAAASADTNAAGGSSAGSATKSRSVSTKSVKAPAKARGASTQRGVQPGTQTLSDTNNAPVPDNAGEGKKYVVDTVGGTPWSKSYTLTQASDDPDNATDPSDSIWRKLVKGLPSRDENGNKYYYYIKSVEETNMPKNTVCSIDVDGDECQILCHKPDDGSDPATLSVSNKVGTPADIDLIKVAKDASGSLTSRRLAGAVFRLERKASATTYEAITDCSVVRMDDQTQTIAVEASAGNFTVPAEGATILLLDPGDYQLVEVTPPDGYVMDKTDYAFTIGQNGKLIHEGGQPAHVTGDYEITVGNIPGAELPHSGGPGTIATTIAGVALMAIGALALLRNRRRMEGERA